MLQQHGQLGAHGEQQEEEEEDEGEEEEGRGQSPVQQRETTEEQQHPDPSILSPPVARDQQSAKVDEEEEEGEEGRHHKRKSRARKGPAPATEAEPRRNIRRRVSTSLPNCLLPKHNQTETGVKGQGEGGGRPEKEGDGAKQQRRGKEGKGAGGGGGVCHRVEPKMAAFLGTVKLKETVEFLRGTIGRSRRKGADLGGGGKETQRQCAGNNAGNGICPMPDTLAAASAAATSSACTSGKTGVVSFSQAGSAKSARKAVQSVDTCVADSFDEQMIDKICTLPRNMDRSEWMAAHVLALFEHVNGISCTLSEICTPVTCSAMNYPGNQKAPWLDERGKRHNYSAMRYIDSVMSFCEASRTNQAIFPTKYGVPFAADFETYSARMVRLLWHCLGHMFAKHWDHLGSLNLRPQFGLVLAHLARLAKMYGMMAEKELQSVQNTLQLARPSCCAAAPNQPRPLKRGLDETGEMPKTTAMVANPNTVQGRIQQAQQKKQQQQATVNAMKSGSWGGHSAEAPPVANSPAALLANCQKCYAQTC